MGFDPRLPAPEACTPTRQSIVVLNKAAQQPVLSRLLVQSLNATCRIAIDSFSCSSGLDANTLRRFSYDQYGRTRLERTRLDYGAEQPMKMTKLRLAAEQLPTLNFSQTQWVLIANVNQLTSLSNELFAQMGFPPPREIARFISASLSSTSS